MPKPIEQHEGKKYLHTIWPAGELVTCDPKLGKMGVQVDVYAVLEAFGVTCPARAHAVKKLLCCGNRGKGSAMQDLLGVEAAVARAIQLQEVRDREQATPIQGEQQEDPQGTTPQGPPPGEELPEVPVRPTPLGLFRSGDFTLRSGRRSRWKIECDAFTTEDWTTLALMASEVLPRFRDVLGVPRGGVPFAQALVPFASGEVSDPFLIAEDVCTTGGSMERFRDSLGGEGPFVGVCVFAREPTWPGWVKPLFCFNPLG